ncbi:hypothetical protein SNEBB_004905 [Seison nebaliae]|nr:hypothetical protein SNEBB_004905 [Seison nebaliae]
MFDDKLENICTNLLKGDRDDYWRAYYQLKELEGIDENLDTSILATIVLLSSILNDPSSKDESDSQIHNIGAHASYALSISKFVNIMVEPLQLERNRPSIRTSIVKLNLPKYFTNLRHDVTHSSSLPSFIQCKDACYEALNYLIINYWKRRQLKIRQQEIEKNVEENEEEEKCENSLLEKELFIRMKTNKQYKVHVHETAFDLLRFYMSEFYKEKDEGKIVKKWDGLLEELYRSNNLMFVDELKWLLNEQIDRLMKKESVEIKERLFLLWTFEENLKKLFPN